MLLSLCSCMRVSRQVRTEVDSLCMEAYAVRYTDIDSSRNAAQRAFEAAHAYPDGQARALNRMAYVRYQRMDYDGTLAATDSVYDLCNHQVLLLSADVMRMKVFQRVGDGRGFYEARSSALRRLKRINEDVEQLDEADMAEYHYAWTEFHIISSTYFYYQEQYIEAKAEMAALTGQVEKMGDVTQLLYYYYMLGSGGLLDGSYEDVARQEFRYLMDCYVVARRANILYFEANALQALATRLKTPYDREILSSADPDGYALLVAQHLSWMPDSTEIEGHDLPLALAHHALSCFQRYDDLFQTACVYRTIGELEAYEGHYDHALEVLAKALACVNEHHDRYYPQSREVHLSLFNADDLQAQHTENLWIQDSHVRTVPEWMAGIRQQLSMLYSAMDDKAASDYNRNIYLDIMESTSQNREMESRMDELEKELRIQRHLLLAAACVWLLLCTFAGMTFFRMKKHEGKKKLMKGDMQRLQTLSEQLEETEEAVAACRMHIQRHKMQNSEKRAKVSLAQAVIPFLDRIINEVNRMKRSRQMPPSQVEYVTELSDQIIQYNDILTDWIKVEQGQLSMHISTLDIGHLFRILERGHFAFDQKGVSFHVRPTELRVKADEALTLFMLNTLCDNARKFTPQGGSVTVEATATEEYVELSVSDTGCGMSEADIDTILNHKAYDASKIGVEGGAGTEGQKGFGFGLMNCKGIIEKYKKTAARFSVCLFGIESTKGKGSRFFFRLPRVMTLLLLALLFHDPLHAAGQDSKDVASADSLRAEAFYQKVYESNVEGRYEDALYYADSCLYYIEPALALFISPSISTEEAYELKSFLRGADMNYRLLIALRNEVAIAALALHAWELYLYNNAICIHLHKLYNQDATLPSYCDELAKTEAVSRQLTALLVVMSLLMVFFIYLFFRVKKRAAERIASDIEEKLTHTQDMLSHLKYEENRLYVQNQVLDNCLSTIKHESMYYPSRIRFLVTQPNNDVEARITELDELTAYYKQLYMLLCGQAERQAGQQTARRERVTLEALVALARKECETLTVEGEEPLKRRSAAPPLRTGDIQVRVDATLMQELWHQLFKYVRQAFGARCAVTLRLLPQDGCLRVEVCPEGMCLTEEEAHTLFYPDSQRIPLLIVKQIIRDFDALNNNPGLRLVAEEHMIWFQLITDKNGKLQSHHR